MKGLIVVSVAAGALAGLVMAGGCVSNDEYQRALLMNRKMAEQLDLTNKALNEQQARFAAKQREIDELNAQIARLNSENDILKKARADLEARLAAVPTGGVKIPAPPVGFPLPAALNKALKELADKYGPVLTFDPEHGMVKFKADTTFDPGSDRVSNEAREAISKLAEILNDPIAQPFNAYVAGHTDDIPIVKEETKRRHPNNWYLSVHRAVAIEELLEKDKVAPERLGAMGFGEYHPVAPNAPGHKGNVLNRRVEVWIVPPERFMTVNGGTAAPATTGGGETEK
ncbi:MAG: OmpA family protein [Phycisphaerae bacterium]